MKKERAAKIEATVVMARCSNSKAPYGIRMEKRNKEWFCTWAFAMPEEVAKREGFAGQSVKGDIDMDYDYPGCPHCGGGGFVQCNQCNNIGCFKDGMKLVVCPHCGNRMESFVEDGNFDIKAGAH